MSTAFVPLARVSVDEIPHRDFTHYEVGVSPLGTGYNDAVREVHQACLKKTADNLGVNYTPDLYLICKSCVYHTRMPGIYLYQDGRCNMCHTYEKTRADAKKDGTLKKELAECLAPETASNATCDVILGLSGGKDSSATLYYLAVERGLRVKAVLVDNGFIPDSVVENCRQMCNNVNAEFILLNFDFRKKIEEIMGGKDLNYYPCDACSKRFKNLIADYAVTQNCTRIILGRNFWATVEPELSALRVIQASNGTSIRCYSLPFLLDWTFEDMASRLAPVGWNTQNGAIPGLSTNCVVPGMVEQHYIDNTGIHPETALHANEVITGFITREEAIEELGLVEITADRITGSRPH